MNGCAIPIIMKEKTKFKTLRLSNKANRTKPPITKERSLSSAISPVAIIFDYILGLHAGAALGYMSGACFGSLYKHYYQPSDFNNWNEIKRSLTIPISFSVKGAVIGMIIGVLFITVLVIRQSILEQKKGGKVKK